MKVLRSSRSSGPRNTSAKRATLRSISADQVAAKAEEEQAGRERTARERLQRLQARRAANASAAEPDPATEKFRALAEAARAGVEVVAVDQLFPTPPPLAARMAEIAQIEPGSRVLEPSAGTGNLLRAIGPGPNKVAVEINRGLVELLARDPGSGSHVIQGDFLKLGEEDLGRFDRIVMNPPFANGVDIKHIRHAVELLRPNGILVALCANGPGSRGLPRPQ